MNNKNKNTYYFTLKHYTPGAHANFCIQCKGLHSGKPLANPIPNSICVLTNIPNLDCIVRAAYFTRMFEQIIKGSVVPFVTIGDVNEVIVSAMAKYEPNKYKQLEAMENIDTLILKSKKTIDLYNQLQRAIAHDVLSK